MPTSLGALVWLNYATFGTQVAYNDNYVTVMNKNGRADLRVADVTAPAKATLLAPQADVDFFLTPDRRQIFYTDTNTGFEGLYLTPVPGAPPPPMDAGMPPVDLAAPPVVDLAAPPVDAANGG
jgi:hypothetical protein